MFARLERRNYLISMQLQGSIDMNDINLWVGKHLFVVIKPYFDSVTIADLVELTTGSLTNGVHLSIRVTLVDRDELCAKLQANDTDLENLIGCHQFSTPNSSYILPGRRDVDP